MQAEVTLVRGMQPKRSKERSRRDTGNLWVLSPARTILSLWIYVPWW
jgi:hypothetical protein